jgi:hypothetical protein
MKYGSRWAVGSDDGTAGENHEMGTEVISDADRIGSAGVTSNGRSGGVEGVAGSAGTNAASS